MPPFDPYAPPTSLLADAPLGRAGAIHRVGRLLVIERGSEDGLPDSCVKCGRSANGYRLQKKLHWHPRWVFLLFFLNVLVYAIGAMATRKWMTVAIPLCDLHRDGRSRTLQVSGGLMALSILSCGGSFTWIGDYTTWVLLLTGMVGLVALMVFSQNLTPIKPSKIDAEGGQFLGAHVAFLDQIDANG